ncbi:hypothetical protein DY000_02032893 [Brassica cretica]|uniref:Uncharacterized protein n=1 Tax=Brassica cretica TaxID=69181 RepID=A0ABQ7DGG0_BRACR|nr:hypothetical protein DY000_02032893 [Brassica cretica]
MESTRGLGSISSRIHLVMLSNGWRCRRNKRQILQGEAAVDKEDKIVVPPRKEPEVEKKKNRNMNMSQSLEKKKRGRRGRRKR